MTNSPIIMWRVYYTTPNRPEDYTLLGAVDEKEAKSYARDKFRRQACYRGYRITRVIPHKHDEA